MIVGAFPSFGPKPVWENIDKNIVDEFVILEKIFNKKFVKSKTLSKTMKKFMVNTPKVKKNFFNRHIK